MEEHIVKVLKVENVTHNVRRFTVSKPDEYSFIPGQATEVSINTKLLKDEMRPFTFTGLNDWPTLEFTTKIYTDHHGVTEALGKVKEGDELLIHDVWGAINYKGLGVFIAGGAGVTPFIAIFRKLHKDNKLEGNRLIFSNKTEKDIILKDEFNKMLGENFYNTLTQEKSEKYDHRKIDKAFLLEKIKNFSQNFYICGPDQFVKDITNALEELGAKADSVVFEK
ncbi:MAG: FAD-binding oxidoreductase [Ignavibacteriaceae bacterium]|jgi:ferredoxin-NADP reductase